MTKQEIILKKEEFTASLSNQNFLGMELLHDIDNFKKKYPFVNKG